MPDFITEPLWPELLLATVLVASFALGGSRFRLIFDREPQDRALILLDGFAVSYLIVSTLLFVFAYLGQLSGYITGVIWVWLLAAGGIGLSRLLKRQPPFSPADNSAQENRKGFAEYLIILGLFTVFLFGLAAALVPEVWADAIAYHLPLTRSIAKTGTINYSSDMFPSGFPLSAELINVLFVPLGGIQAGKPQHFIMGLLTLVAIYQLGKQVSGKSMGLFAAFLFAAMPLNWWLMSTANNDLHLCLFFTLAVVHLVKFDKEGKKADLLLAGLCGSLPIIIKINGCVSLLLLFIFALPALYRHLRQKNIQFRTIALACLLALLPAALWAFRSWQQTGTPCYPLFISFFGIDPDTNFFLRFVQYQLSENSGNIQSWKDVVLMPIHLVWSPDLFGHLAIGWSVPAFLCISIFMGLKERFAVRLLIVFIVGVLFWLISVRLVRLLEYCWPLACILAAYPIAKAKTQVYKTFLVLAVVATTIISLPGVWQLWQPEHWRLEPVFSRDLLSGKIDRQAYMTEHSQVSSSYRAHDWANKNLPAGQNIFSIKNSDHLFTDHNLIDTGQSTDGWFMQKNLLEGDPDQALTRMSKRQITHILVDNSRKQTTHPLLDRLTLLYANEGFTWYRLENIK